MQNLNATIMSQYANSASLMTLLDAMNQYLDPRADFDAFIANVWGQLADDAVLNDYGLDVWGRIVGVTRNLHIPADIANPGGYSFTAGTYRLDNRSFRTLILVKALSNITSCTAPSINALLTSLFKGRGRCYTRDVGNMAMELVFEFYLLPYEYALVATSGAVPHPAGVKVSIVQLGVGDTFGFQGSNLQPLNQGTFYTSE